VFVKDVVQSNIKAATNSDATTVYNVANGFSITIKELCELIIETTASNSSIQLAAPRPGDIKHSLASIDRTKKDLDFRPEYDLREGLKQTIEYFMEIFG